MTDNSDLLKRIDSVLEDAPDVILMRMVRNDRINIVRMDERTVIAIVPTPSSEAFNDAFDWARLLAAAPHLLREARTALAAAHDANGATGEGER